MRGRLVAAALFAAFSLGWTFPLVSHLQSHVPGVTAGDNVAFIWNFWWMRQALSTGASFFHTDHLFAPFGIDLVLYTHTALGAFVGATLLARLSVVTAQNVVILASLALNGFAAFLLAFDRTRDWGASMFGGLLFAGSPYIAGHLLGHFNLISAWSLPLFLLCLLRVLDASGSSPDGRARPNASISAVGAGLCVIAIAYTDYYYLVYAGVLGAGLVVARVCPLGFSVSRTPQSRGAGRVLAALAALDVLLIAVIVVSGGFSMHLGPLTITGNRIVNELSVLWVLAAIALVLRYRPRIAMRWGGAPAIEGLRPLALTAAIAAAGVAPLVWKGASLMMRGDYVRPRATWRSGAGGVDVATLVFGSPWHPLWGAHVGGWYARLSIDPIERSAYLGVVPLVLLYLGVRQARRDPELRLWLAIGGAFGLWALGPWLSMAGFNTGLMLPENLFQFVPVLSNARIPGRAMAVVLLALGMIAASVLSRLKRHRTPVLLPAIALLVVFDYLPAPFPLTHLEPRAIYASLPGLDRPGSVCELPTGIHDGFGGFGAFDDRALFDQTRHGRPIVGGSTSRLPQSIQDGYRAMPVVRSLFRLSAGLPADAADDGITREAAVAALDRAGIGYFVLNRAAASAALIRYVESTLPVSLAAKDGEQELYVIAR